LKILWFKFERLKIFKDQFGRATQSNFTVIDVEKKFDKDIAYDLVVIINPLDKKPVTLHGKLTPVK